MKKNKIIISLCTIVFILISIIICLLISIHNKKQFVKPEFDKNVGVIPEGLEYQKNALKISDGYLIYVEPMPKKIDEEYLKINLISSIDNRVWLKIRILDDNKEIIAESGLVKPGEYLEKVKLTKSVNSEANITYKIMGYQTDNYISAGAISLNTRIGE